MADDWIEIQKDDAHVARERAKARELGMRTMREDGVRKIGGGLTTADEVLKVTMNEA